MKDTLSVKEFQQMLKNGVITTGKKGRLKQEELLPEYAAVLNDENKQKNLHKAEFNIPGSLVTLNDYINAERTDRYKAANIKKKMTNYCGRYAIKLKGLIDPNRMYDVEMYWTQPDNMKDADNVFFAQKWILDSLVKTGILKNDGRKNIRNIHHYIDTVKNITNVKVVLLEII